MLFSKLNFLFALLCMFVIGSGFAEQKQRKSNSAPEAKKNLIDSENGSDDYRRREQLRNEEQEEEEGVDDHLIAALSYADNRYSPFQAREGNYRTRSRWPAQASSPFDDLMNGNDWSQFHLQNLFPSPPSISLDANPMLSSSPSCYSLVDSQYPIFSDVCGAVPQARYSLPNTFGHRERWQVAQILSNLLSSSSDSSCTRSLRLLLCPVLFPPCPTRHEPPAVLPCQSYCRAIKARCAIPALDLLPCEVLPQSSDLCPTHQGYGSFVPSGAFPPVNQQPPVNNNAFPSSNYPVPRSYSSLQSLLSSQGSQSTPSNLFNNGPFASDSLSPMLVDFPARSYNNDYRQNSKYASPTRSATDLRPKVDAQYSTSQRPSSMVMA